MDGVNKKQVDDALALKVNKAGDIMAGNLDMGDKKIINLSNPTSNSDACTKKYLLDNCMTYNNNGDWNAEGRQIYNVNQTFNTEDLIPDIKYIKGKTIWSDSYGNFNARNKVIFNNRINGNNTDAVNVKWVNAVNAVNVK